MRSGENLILQEINLEIHEGEHWAIIGPSGSGKTTLANVIAGKIFHLGQIDFHITSGQIHGIELVEQQQHFKNLSNTSQFYYQQRFNASEAEDSITVQQALQGYDDKKNWLTLLQLTALMNEPLIQLSNGESKRLQIVKSLTKDPTLLILDNPFVGLDTTGRQILHHIINEITSNGICVIIITTPHELPSSITHIAFLDKGQLQYSGVRDGYFALHPEFMGKPALPDPAKLKLLQPALDDEFEFAIAMDNVNISYSGKKILTHINWQVKKSECWSLSGPNGAGKSTLLSLVTADNPQAYANNIILFDRKRGSGESIWDIKKKIGFVSPELHLYFDQSVSCFELIASGLFDTIGLFRILTAEQEGKVILWMQLLKLELLQHKFIYQLSMSEQRLALLARALIKNPPLLVLDEPCQGLDELQTAFFKELINQICTQFRTTLVYVSHYSRDIPACVNHFLKMENGRISEIN